VGQLAFDPTGTLVAVAGNDAGVEVWDAFTGRLRRRIGRHGAPVEAVRFSPDGALLYSLGSDRRVRVWELGGGAELGALAVDAYGGLDLSRDGSRLLVHQHLGAVSFWDVSREPRPAARVAEVVGCLVPMDLADDGRLVTREPRLCP
jgi:WD40 repeat protein